MKNYDTKTSDVVEETTQEPTQKKTKSSYDYLSYTERFLGILFAMLKFIFIGGFVGLFGIGFFYRDQLFDGRIDSLIGGSLAYFIIGAAIGVLIFLLIATSGKLEMAGADAMLIGYGLFNAFELSTGGIILIFFVALRFIYVVINVLTCVPITMVFWLIMTIIERFIPISEGTSKVLDYIPKVLTIIANLYFLFMIVDKI